MKNVMGVTSNENVVYWIWNAMCRLGNPMAIGSPYLSKFWAFVNRVYIVFCFKRGYE